MSTETSDPAWEVVARSDERTRHRPGDRALAADLVAAARVEAAQEPVRARISAMVEGATDPLDRDHLPDHLTASAVVVDLDRGALLVHHRKLRRWFQPGGHVDGDGNLLAAALREAAEETGLGGLTPVLPAVDLDVHDVAYPDGSFHVHHDVRFLLLAAPGSVVAPNHESTEARWVEDAHDLDRLDVDVSTRRVVLRGLAVATGLDQPR